MFRNKLANVCTSIDSLRYYSSFYFSHINSQKIGKYWLLLTFIDF